MMNIPQANVLAVHSQIGTVDNVSLIRDDIYVMLDLCKINSLMIKGIQNSVTLIELEQKKILEIISELSGSVKQEVVSDTVVEQPETVRVTTPRSTLSNKKPPIKK